MQRIQDNVNTIQVIVGFFASFLYMHSTIKHETQKIYSGPLDNMERNSSAFNSKRLRCKLKCIESR